MLDQVLSLIAPHRCLGCGAAGNLLCPNCSRTDLPRAVSRCYRCHQATKQFQVCPRCRNSVALTHVWIVSAYEGLAKDILHAFKFQRCHAASVDVARCMDELLPLIAQDTVVCHIPTAPGRIRKRGYDQSCLIAKSLARQRKFTYTPLLKRQSSTRQLGASRKQRFVQASQAFKAVNVPKDAHILLIDDVTTSGASLEAAAQLLKKAGAKAVAACVFAQAIN